VPKAAMLSHANVIAVTAQCNMNFKLYPNDVHLSFLPMAHMAERTIYLTAISNGAGIGFYHGEVLEMKFDAQVLKPTVFLCVPRLLNKIYDGI
jgi:long-chain acyl-CoA synthetase